MKRLYSSAAVLLTIVVAVLASALLGGRLAEAPGDGGQQTLQATVLGGLFAFATFIPTAFALVIERKPDPYVWRLWHLHRRAVMAGLIGALLLVAAAFSLTAVALARPQRGTVFYGCQVMVCGLVVTASLTAIPVANWRLRSLHLSKGQVSNLKVEQQTLLQCLAWAASSARYDDVDDWLEALLRLAREAPDTRPSVAAAIRQTCVAHPVDRESLRRVLTALVAPDLGGVEQAWQLLDQQPVFSLSLWQEFANSLVAGLAGKQVGSTVRSIVKKLSLEDKPDWGSVGSAARAADWTLSPNTEVILLGCAARQALGGPQGVKDASELVDVLAVQSRTGLLNATEVALLLFAESVSIAVLFLERFIRAGDPADVETPASRLAQKWEGHAPESEGALALQATRRLAFAATECRKRDANLRTASTAKLCLVVAFDAMCHLVERGEYRLDDDALVGYSLTLAEASRVRPVVRDVRNRRLPVEDFRAHNASGSFARFRRLGLS